MCTIRSITEPNSLTIGNVLKSFVFILVKVVVSRFDSHIILGGYNVLIETAYNLWIKNSLLILYDPTGSHTRGN